MYQLVLYMFVTFWQFLKVGAQTETELKEKKLRVEDALNATKVLFNILSLPKFYLPLPLMSMLAKNYMKKQL